jgi:hypothetical protein
MGDGRHSGNGAEAPAVRSNAPSAGWAGMLFLSCLVWLLPLPAAALSILPGHSFEVDFSMAASAPTADVLTFRLGAGTTATGVTGVTVSLYDGNTLLASRSGALGDLTAFVGSGSAWTLNAVTADFTSLQSGAIVGRIVVTPTFDGSPGAVLDAMFFPASDLLMGHATGASSLVPLGSGTVTFAQPFALPEPGSLALLAAAAALLGAGAPRRS